MIKRAELEQKLLRYFEEHHFDNQTINQFDELMWNNHHYLDAKTVFIGSSNISDLSDEELFWFAHLVQNFSKGTKNINVKRYFSDREEKLYIKSKANDPKESIYPMEFHAQRVGFDQWVGTITADRLMELYNSQVINYNIETQRNPVVKYNRAGEEQLEINVNKKSVESIRMLMRNNLFISNTITLNVREDDDENEIDFDEYNGILILKNGRFDIIDGYHRYQAIIREKINNPNFVYNMIVMFTNFDTNKAKRYIAQEDKRNKINATYASSLDDTKYGTQIVNKLNQDTDFYLQGQFKPYKKQGNCFTIGRVGGAIDEAFNIYNPRSASKLEKCICSIANDIIDKDEKLIVDDRDMRILVYSIAALKIDYENYTKLDEEQLERIMKYLTMFQNRFKYDVGKTYSTIKKILIEYYYIDYHSDYPVGMR